MDDRYQVRPGRPEGVTALADLNAAVHLQEQTGGQPHAGIAAWVRDLFDGHHAAGPEDFLVAEDTGGGVAAGLVGIPQRWSCGPVQVPVVQVELVATDPAHRGNRLTGRLLAALHERAARGGPRLFAIEGIPYFYRRFGYEYGIAIGGAPLLPAAALPPATPATPAAADPAVVRPATEADADALAAVDKALARGDVLACPRTAALWRYELAGRSPDSLERREVAALLGAGGQVTGYLAHRPVLNPVGQLVVVAAACADPAGWPALVPAALGHLAAAGERLGRPDRPFAGLRLDLDATHPLSRLGPAGPPRRPYAWYVRADDPVALLRWWQPALARRWREADLRWPGEDLVIDTYRHRIRLGFRDGELTDIDGQPPAGARTHAAVPAPALLQLVLGYRTLPEIQYAWPDSMVRDPVTELFLETAFPRLPAMVWPTS